jgi:hypothetical protein
VDAFGEVGLRVVAEEAFGLGRQEEIAVVCVFFGDGVGEFAGEVDVAVEKGDEGAAGILAGKVGEDDGFDVRVGFEAVDEADAGVVDYDNGVCALVGDVVDEGVGEIVVGSGSVPAFLGPGVDEDEAGVAFIVYA